MAFFRVARQLQSVDGEHQPQPLAYQKHPGKHIGHVPADGPDELRDVVNCGALSPEIAMKTNEPADGGG